MIQEPNLHESSIHPFIGWTNPMMTWDWHAKWQALLNTRLGKWILQRGSLSVLVEGWMP